MSRPVHQSDSRMLFEKECARPCVNAGDFFRGLINILRVAHLAAEAATYFWLALSFYLSYLSACLPALCAVCYKALFIALRKFLI
jgi:hypothetical protein